MSRQTNLIHFAGMLQVSKLIKRESGTDFEKGMWGTLLTELAVFVNRYMFLCFMEISDESVPLLIIEVGRFLSQALENCQPRFQHVCHDRQCP